MRQNRTAYMGMNDRIKLRKQKWFLERFLKKVVLEKWCRGVGCSPGKATVISSSYQIAGKVC